MNFTQVKVNNRSRKVCPARRGHRPDRLRRAPALTFRQFLSSRRHVRPTFQVPTNAFEFQLQSIAFSTHVSDPSVSDAPLPPAKDFLYPAADRTEQLVDSQSSFAPLPAATGFAQDAIGHSVLTAPLTVLVAPIGFVGHDHLFVACNYALKLPAVVHAGFGQTYFTNKSVRFIHRHVRFVTVVRCSFLDGVVGVAVAAFIVFIGWRSSGGLQQRRVGQGAGLEYQSFPLQLLVDQSQQLLVQAMFNQPLAEANQSRFIGHGLFKTKSDKLAPGESVFDLFLALRVGKVVTMLEQEHFEDAERRLGQAAGGGGEHAFEPALDRQPINQLIETLEEVISWSRLNQSVEQVHLWNRSCAHVSLIFYVITLFKRFAEVSDGYFGSAPDIGAYETGAPYWSAGANFSIPPFPRP